VYGVPLFVEELTKMVLEAGFLRAIHDHYEITRALPPLAIPASLHDALMARLDRLATVNGWFTEGFDTADLQEAKMLLEELA
jgi:predicted ATPase